MCGIVGIFSSHVDKEQLTKATTALAHRGPDGEGLWISANKQVGLGHRRLSIVDIHNGRQPMANRNHTLYATVNGELYDDDLLRKNLIEKGYIFQSRSDSELILYLYEEYGIDFIHHLRGEFAFILFDSVKNIMIAARDRFGIKPLCYYFNNKKLLLASEAKAIIAAGITAEWNESALYQALCLQYIPIEQTLFKNIQQLAPGHMLIYDGKKLQIKEYWDLNYQTAQESKLNIDDLTLELEKKLKEAITCRLRSDNIKLCCHLSGGIDSATIAALASQALNTPLPCFSVTFPHASYDESPTAYRLAQHIGAEFHPVAVDADDMIDVLPAAVYFSEGLAINNHLSAKYLLNRAIKKAGFKIALTGEGSDELFTGYAHFKQDYHTEQTENIFAKNILSTGLQISNDTTLSLEKVKHHLNHIPSFIKAKAAIGYKLHQLLKPSDHSADDVFNTLFAKNNLKQKLNGIHPVQQSSYLWIKFALNGYILRTLGDGCEMAHSIEGRVPFLDHHLFDFSKKIPLSLKIKNNIEKYILREAVKKHITPEIYQRQKHPFLAPPLSLLSNQRGIEFVYDCLHSARLKSLPFYDDEKIKHYLKQFPTFTMSQHIAAEPVIMMILTSYLLAQQYNL